MKLEALQPVTRDFAFVMAEGVPADKLIKAIKNADKTLIREVSIFDVYQGKGIEPGQKSVAVAVTIQPGEKSLTEAELAALAEKITTGVKAVGAELR